MNIATKYNIGDVFYLPRSKKTFGEDEVITVDGKEYTRMPYSFVPSVKKRTISAIEANVREDGTTEIRYQLVADDDVWPHHYYEDVLTNGSYRTYGEALHVAEEYAIHKKQEYFG